VIDDDQVCLADLEQGFAVEAGFGRAVAAVAGGAVRVYPIPDFMERSGHQLLQEPCFGGLRPVGQSFEFRHLIVGKQFSFSLDRLSEAGSTQVISPAHQECCFEILIGMELRKLMEESAAEAQIVVKNLFLQRDGVAGNEKLPLGRHRENESGQQVGEAFADTGSGFEKKGFIAGQGLSDCERHLGLLGTMFEFEVAHQRTTWAKNVFDQVRQEGCSRQIARFGRLRLAGVRIV